MSKILQERHRLIKSRHSQGGGDHSVVEENTISREQSEYEILAQFELRREKEKTRILEERLHNKEVFIHQMKEYQEQLTVAFEKCQEELTLAKRQLETMKVMEREHLEEMAELKHLIIRLEEEIVRRDDQKKGRHFSSVKVEETSPKKVKQKRSKTFMNEEKDIYPQKSQIEAQLIQESKKIGKFLTNFLLMVECFCPGVKEGALKTRLKVAWKWIKNVVKEWNELQTESNVTKGFLSQARKRLSLPKHSTKQQAFQDILEYLQS